MLISAYLTATSFLTERELLYSNLCQIQKIWMEIIWSSQGNTLERGEVLCGHGVHIYTHAHACINTIPDSTKGVIPEQCIFTKLTN